MVRWQSDYAAASRSAQGGSIPSRTTRKDNGMKRKITWPKYDKKGKLTKDGTLNGVPLQKIWKQCQREATVYMKKRFPEELCD